MVWWVVGGLAAWYAGAAVVFWFIDPGDQGDRDELEVRFVFWGASPVVVPAFVAASAACGVAFLLLRGSGPVGRAFARLLLPWEKRPPYGE